MEIGCFPPDPNNKPYQDPHECLPTPKLIFFFSPPQKKTSSLREKILECHKSGSFSYASTVLTKLVKNGKIDQVVLDRPPFFNSVCLTLHLNPRLSFQDLMKVEFQFRKNFREISSEDILEFYSIFFTCPAIVEVNASDLRPLFETSIHNNYSLCFLKALLSPSSKAPISRHLLLDLEEALSEHHLHLSSEQYQELQKFILKHSGAHLFLAEDLIAITTLIHEINKLEKIEYLELSSILTDLLGKSTPSEEELLEFVCLIWCSTTLEELFSFLEHPTFNLIPPETLIRIKKKYEFFDKMNKPPAQPPSKRSTPSSSSFSDIEETGCKEDPSGS